MTFFVSTQFTEFHSHDSDIKVIVCVVRLPKMFQIFWSDQKLRFCLVHLCHVCISHFCCKYVCDLVKCEWGFHNVKLVWVWEERDCSVEEGLAIVFDRYTETTKN